MQKVDYIIVGQGLAGSVLAHELMLNGKGVLVVDSEPESTSSKVAAGLCNPIVFKRLNKSWMVDEVLHLAKDFYRKQEKLLDQAFYHDMPIYKLFNSQAEVDFWKQKSNEPELFDYLSPKIEHPFDEQVQHPYGAAHVFKSGFLHTKKWLEAYCDYLKANNAYVNDTFDYADLILKESGVQWKAIQAKQIIFCEGYKGAQNPYFEWLPLTLTKGETVTLDFNDLTLNVAINKGAFVLPYDGHFKVGATYDWDNKDEIPTQEGKWELLEKIGKFIDHPATVIKHQAGVRPTVKDRRPLLGVHPEHGQLVVFNGLGTKGVMLAPYMAKKLVALLLNNHPLPADIDIKRFQAS